MSICTRCDLHKTATHVKLPFKGSNDPIILFVGSSPNITDDNTGVCFSGKDGKLLQEEIGRSGIDIDTCRFTNLVNCPPWEDVDKRRRIRKPNKEEIDACHVYLERDIQRVDPIFIVPLGSVALKYFIENAPVISKARGKRYITQVPSKRTITQKCKKLLSIHNINHIGITYEELTEKAKELGYDPEIKQYTVIPLYYHYNVFRSDDQQTYKKRTEFISDLNYLSALINKKEEYQDKEYRTLQTIEEIEELYEEIKELYAIGTIGRIIPDIESIGVDPFSKDFIVLGWGISWWRYKAVFVPFQHKESPFYNDPLKQKAIIALTNDLFSKIPIANHNVKFDIHAFHAIGITVKVVQSCTFLASWVLFNQSIVKHDLDTLASEHTEFKHHKQELQRRLNDLKGLVFDEEGNEREPNYGDIDLNLLSRYCCLDCDSARALESVFRNKMKELGLLEGFETFTVPAILPVCRIERNGIKFNTDMVDDIVLEFQQEIDDCYLRFWDWGFLQKAAEIHKRKKGKLPVQRVLEIDGNKESIVKLSSPEVKKIVLFDILKFRSVKPTKGKKDKNRFPCTDKEVLKELKSICVDRMDKNPDYYQIRLDAVETLMRFNKTSTIFTRYLKPLPGFVDHNSTIHTSFGIGTTDTTRWNCTKPSLHIIPKKSIVKNAFYPIFDHGLIMLVDYSQNELRVIAILANDKKMIQIFKDGKDLHGEVCKELGVNRRTAKAINFGIAFGQTDFGLAASLKISRDQAAQYIANWYNRFQGVKRWVKGQHIKARRKGEVWLPIGFRRLIPEQKFSQAEKNRRFVNTPVQGTASKFGELALSIVDDKAIRMGLNSRMFAFIHDALAWNVYPNELYQVASMSKRVLERVIPHRISFIKDSGVPLVGDFELGHTWGTLLDMSLSSDNRIRVEGNEEYFDNLIETIEYWNPTPEVTASKQYVEDNQSMVKAIIKLSV